ncbi:hypothetical protein C8R47DRAFT_1074303 [Mycena vitilis]|nr:hypothetical protein C8R47DRAFT_1074303 [Mycena vitilis]
MERASSLGHDLEDLRERDAEHPRFSRQSGLEYSPGHVGLCLKNPERAQGSTYRICGNLQRTVSLPPAEEKKNMPMFYDPAPNRMGKVASNRRLPLIVYALLHTSCEYASDRHRVDDYGTCILGTQRMNVKVDEIGPPATLQNPELAGDLNDSEKLTSRSRVVDGKLSGPERFSAAWIHFRGTDKSDMVVATVLLVTYLSSVLRRADRWKLEGFQALLAKSKMPLQRTPPRRYN